MLPDFFFNIPFDILFNISLDISSNMIPNIKIDILLNNAQFIAQLRSRNLWTLIGIKNVFKTMNIGMIRGLIYHNHDSHTPLLGRGWEQTINPRHFRTPAPSKHGTLSSFTEPMDIHRKVLKSYTV